MKRTNIFLIFIIALLLVLINSESKAQIRFPVTVDGKPDLVTLSFDKNVIDRDSIRWHYRDTTVLNYLKKDTTILNILRKDTTVLNVIKKDTLILNVKFRDTVILRINYKDTCVTTPPVAIPPAVIPGQTVTLTFNQRTDDYPRTGAGAGQWHGGYEVTGVPQSLDRYDRLTWYQLEPVHGDYKLTALVSKINAAIDKGQKYQFGGVMTACPGCDIGYNVSYGGGSSPYPLWVHNLMQSDQTKDQLINGNWFPNYNSENYLNPLSDLLKAINTLIKTGSYKGVLYKNVVNEADIRGYGSWGEWNHNSHENGIFGTAATLKRIIQMHIDAFPDIQLIGLVAAYDGGRLSILNVPAEVGYFLLTAKNNIGRIGSRRDSYTDGAESDKENYLHFLLEKNPVKYNGVQFDTLINNLWKYAPQRGESVCGGPVEILADQVKFYHTGSFGNGNFCLGTLSSTQISAVKAAAAAAGYRITLTGGSVNQGSITTITLNWSNLNRPPTYDNWDIIFQVNGVTIGKSGMKLRLFTGTKSFTDTFTNVPKGQLTVKVVDPAGYAKPMTIGITGQNVDGSINLTTIN